MSSCASIYLTHVNVLAWNQVQYDKKVCVIVLVRFLYLIIECFLTFSVELQRGLKTLA